MLPDGGPHMMRFVTAAALLAPLAFAVGGSAVAQQALPPAAATTARCGGVLCDLYYRDVPAGAPVPSTMTALTPLPCHDFVCGMFGGRTPDQPPAEQVATSPEPAAEPLKPAKKRKHAAKARVAQAKAAETTGDPATATSAAK